MTIILDFDDVLFDTRKFKICLAEIFEKYKIDFHKYYNKAKEPQGAYSLKKHLLLVKKENKKIDIKKIEKDINKINFNAFLFPDAIKFLKKFKNHNLILLSWGEKKFQQTKIYGLGRNFVFLFDKVIIGPEEKAKVLRRILNLYTSKPVIFIDNNPQERKKIRDNFKDIILCKQLF